MSCWVGSLYGSPYLCTTSCGSLLVPELPPPAAVPTAVRLLLLLLLLLLLASHAPCRARDAVM